MQREIASIANTTASKIDKLVNDAANTHSPMTTVQYGPHHDIIKRQLNMIHYRNSCVNVS